MTEEKAIAVREYSLEGTELARYGNRSVARELMQRLMMLHPAARDVGEAGMLACAQLAIVVGANPMPATNEIHIWKSGSSIQLDLGINFFRRRANELGGIYWLEDPRLMTDQERQEYGVPDSQIGAIAKGARIDKIRELMAGGMPWEAALRGLGRTGIGTVSATATAKQGRPVSWTALKGAEKDLCRALFPNFEQPDNPPEYWLETVPKGNGNGDGVILDAEEAERLAELQEQYQETTEAFQALTPEERQDKAAANSRLMYGDPDFEGFDTPPEMTATAAPVWDGEIFAAGEDEQEPDPTPAPAPAPPPPTNGNARPLAPEKVRAFIHKKAGWQNGQRRTDGEPATEKQVPKLATDMGELFPNLNNQMRQKARHDVLNYLIGVTSTNDLYKEEASALIDWCKDQANASIEAARILEAMALEAGQQELPL